MKPSLPNVLEVYRLAEEYTLEKVVPPVGRNSQVAVQVAMNVYHIFHILFVFFHSFGFHMRFSLAV